jgi:hypothetical protein
VVGDAYQTEEGQPSHPYARHAHNLAQAIRAPLSRRFGREIREAAAAGPASAATAAATRQAKWNEGASERARRWRHHC